MSLRVAAARIAGGDVKFPSLGPKPIQPPLWPARLFRDVEDRMPTIRVGHVGSGRVAVHAKPANVQAVVRAGIVHIKVTVGGIVGVERDSQQSLLGKQRIRQIRNRDKWLRRQQTARFKSRMRISPSEMRPTNSLFISPGA